MTPFGPRKSLLSYMFSSVGNWVTDANVNAKSRSVTFSRKKWFCCGTSLTHMSTRRLCTLVTDLHLRKPNGPWHANQSAAYSSTEVHKERATLNKSQMHMTTLSAYACVRTVWLTSRPFGHCFDFSFVRPECSQRK